MLVVNIKELCNEYSMSTYIDNINRICPSLTEQIRGFNRKTSMDQRKIIKLILLENDDTALKFDNDRGFMRKLEFVEHHPVLWSIRVCDSFQYVFDCNCNLHEFNAANNGDELDDIMYEGNKGMFHKSPKFDHEHKLRDWLNAINSRVNASWSPSMGFNQYLV